jgi:hypothetical protein
METDPEITQMIKLIEWALKQLMFNNQDERLSMLSSDKKVISTT